MKIKQTRHQVFVWSGEVRERLLWNSCVGYGNYSHDEIVVLAL